MDTLIKREDRREESATKGYVDDSHDAHYMTPGAREAFKRIKIGYAILAIGMVLGLWYIPQVFNNQLKDNINKVVMASCLESRQPNSVLNKYNRSIDVHINNLREAREINIARGDAARVESNTNAIIALQEVRAPILTVKECSAPILK